MLFHLLTEQEYDTENKSDRNERGRKKQERR